MLCRILIFVGLTFPVVSIYLFFMLHYTGGNLSCPLDDSFIFYQYGRQLAYGEFLRYNSGDPATTGATSLLYTILLSIPHLVGIEGDNIIIFSFILGAILYFISTLLVFSILKELSNSNLISYFGGIIFLLSGPIVWGALSGMDIGLFTTLILAVYYFYINESKKRGNFIKTCIFGCLLALTRPEGWFFVIILLLFILKEKRSLFVLLPIIVISLQALLYTLITGVPTPHTMQAKSHLYRIANDWVYIIHTSIRYFFYMMKEVFGGTGSNFTEYFNANAGQGDLFLPPLAILFFLFGVVYYFGKEMKEKRGYPALLALIWFFSSILAASIVLPVKVHWFRYIIPYFSLFLIFFVLGIAEVSNILGTTKGAKAITSKHIFIGLNIFYVSYFFLIMLCFGVAYGRNCKDIYLQQITLGKWIDKNLEKDAKLAINDVGAIKYYGNRYIIDLVGLVTTEVVKYSTSNNLGNGSIYEYIEKLKVKPDYFIIYPSWFRLEGLGILGEQIVALNLFDPSIAGAGSEAKCVYKADYKYINSGESVRSTRINQQLKGYKLIDKLDVADIKSEMEHNYKVYPVEPELKIRSTAMLASLFEEPNIIISDGGRIISGGEELNVNNITPNKELKVVMRTAGPINLGVYVNNSPVGQWHVKEGDTNLFSEYSFTIPKEYILSTNIRIKIEVVDKHRATYYSCHYFFYQKI